MFLVDSSNASVKRCAFCKYWYDPTNSAIEPLSGKNKWSLINGKKSKCFERNLQTFSQNTCNKFMCKL